MPFESDFPRFVKAVEEKHKLEKVYQNTGRSNQGRFVEGGMFALEANLHSFPGGLKNVGFFSSFSVSPDCTAYIGIVIEEEIHRLYDRLELMKARGAAEEAEGTKDAKFSTTNKHAEFTFRPGALHLRNKIVELDEADLEPTLQVDRLYYAIDDRSGHGLAYVAQFVGELCKLIDRDKISEVALEAEAVLPERYLASPATISSADVVARVNDYGRKYAPELVQSLHHAMGFHPVKHFAILTGLSGSGKTSLALRYAAAIHGEVHLGSDPFVTVCAVRPDWTDPSALLGYRDVFTKHYVVPPFLAAVLKANKNPRVPVFVILDEMNLARIEYYFAPMLSAMESGQPLPLHTSATPIPSEAGLEILPEVEWPTNLYLIGTINIDETTAHPSPKVLDRAVVIDTTDVDLATCLDALAAEKPLAPHVAACRPHIEKLYSVMKAGGLGFGYRTVDEIVRYLACARNDDASLTFESVFDSLLLTRIVPKLRGTARQRTMLEELEKLSVPFASTNRRVGQLLQDLEEGAFEALR